MLLSGGSFKIFFTTNARGRRFIWVNRLVVGIDASHPLVVMLMVHPCVIIWRHFKPRVTKKLLGTGAVFRLPLEASFKES